MGRDDRDGSHRDTRGESASLRNPHMGEKSQPSSPASIKPEDAVAQQKGTDAKKRLDAAQRRRDLGRFLKAKRSLLQPGDVGLPSLGRRRTPGLRREEIAQVAEIGVTWYTWLEQGRDINVSVETFQRLARTLRLSPHDASYLFSLAGYRIPEIQAPEEGLCATLQGLLVAHTWPGVALNALFDLVGHNDLANSIFRFDQGEGSRGRNQIWRMFMEPARRELHVDWPDCARSAVGLLRAAYAERKDDGALLRLVEELCDASPEFEGLWEESSRIGLHSQSPSGLRLRVPGMGLLHFFPIRLGVPMHPGWYVMLLQPADRCTAETLGRMRERSEHSSGHGAP